MLKPKPNLMPHTHNTTDSTTESTMESTTESTTVKELSPVLEYTMLTQPTSMELESMVPTHTHNTANSNKDFIQQCLMFRHKMTLKSKNISQLRKIPKKNYLFLSKFLLSIIMGNEYLIFFWFLQI